MSKKIGLFYGTQTGKTESVAEIIRDEFGDDVVTLHDVSQADLNDFDEYQYLIFGCPTWNIGELQSDWEGIYQELDEIDFNGKRVAYFGTGDQIGYNVELLATISSPTNTTISNSFPKLDKLASVF
jgi:flavodoxin I